MNNTPLCRFCAALMAAGLFASCASVPAVVEGEEDLSVGALQRVRDWDPNSGMVAGRAIEGVDGVRCTMTNDKGSWSAITPAIVRVRRSPRPLQFECTKEGYAPSSGTLECLTPRQRQQRLRADGAAASLALAPLVLLGPGAAIQWLEIPIATALAGSPLGDDADVCTYLRILAPMQPQEAR